MENSGLELINTNYYSVCLEEIPEILLQILSTSIEFISLESILTEMLHKHTIYVAHGKINICITTLKEQHVFIATS